MIKRWIMYLAALLGCIIFMAAYRGWVAWILLLSVAVLPWVSLVLSLGLMLLPKVQVCSPGQVTLGQTAQLDVRITSPLPLPPRRCVFTVSHSLTGQSLRLSPGEKLPTEHCGQLCCTSRGLELYDFLGMFRLRRKLPSYTVAVRPIPVAGRAPRGLERKLAQSWKPKYGGGFAENHELRLYRPGDGLNQVHWKLSAKTGKLIIREAMVPQLGRVLLTVDLAGSPDTMDRRLGQLVWMGQKMLEMGAGFEICASTGGGLRFWGVKTPEELTQAVDLLLGCPPALSDSVRDQAPAAAWQYHIGGEADEG